MLKTLPTSVALLTALALHTLCPLSHARADLDHSKFLNFVIFNLPPKYFAGIPLDQRSTLLQALSTDQKDRRLDYRNNYLQLVPEGGASSQLELKLFPRHFARVQNPYPPYVFVHMAKPSTDGSAPAENQHFVLKWNKQSWEDVTESILPAGLDPKRQVRPERKFFGIKAFDYDETRRTNGQGKAFKVYRERASALYVWQDNCFEEQALLPHNSEYEAPFDAEKLAKLALTQDGRDRELAKLIVHAGWVKDERFRYLLESKELSQSPLLAMALASYHYAIDQDQSAVDFIVRRVAEEGRGDTNSLWMMSYFDEWDKTIKAYNEYAGGDGAAGTSAYLWMQTRQALYPENYEEWSAKRKKEKL